MYFHSRRKLCSSNSRKQPAWVYSLFFLHSDFICSLCCFLVYIITFSSFTFLPVFILSKKRSKPFLPLPKQSAQKQALRTFLSYFKRVIIFQDTHWTYRQKESSQQCAGELVSLLAAEHSQASRCNICIFILPWNMLICPFPRHHLHKEQSTGEPPKQSCLCISSIAYFFLKGAKHLYVLNHFK